MAGPHRLEDALALAREQYAAWGVDVDAAVKRLAEVPISIHCWQGDDVGGYENQGMDLGGGLAVTGNYPGKARTPEELRGDAQTALSLIPGRHRFNIHACYVEARGRRIERNALRPEHFQSWMDWSHAQGVPLDFNQTLFAHPKCDRNMTLTHPDAGIRDFWIEHCIACREIGAAFGAAQGSPCLTNLWIPDGMKDVTIDRMAPRQRLVESLDRVFAKPIDPRANVDSVESKLFGIGAESYTPGSHEFYLGYAVSRRKLLCLDAGHFHPTETIPDKISSALLFLDEIALHVSRGIRWDSDHVVILGDELRSTAEELVRNDLLARVHIGLDYFDASINRVAAWVIGVRAMLKALLAALLEPTAMLRKLELDGDYTSRLALLEEIKTLPLGAVWDAYCQQQNVPVGQAWLAEVKRYEKDVLAQRG